MLELLPAGEPYKAIADKMGLSIPYRSRLHPVAFTRNCKFTAGQRRWLNIFSAERSGERVLAARVTHGVHFMVRAVTLAIAFPVSGSETGNIC